jgi:hypothetical protein
MMHHPTGVKENGQHDLDIAVDLPCFSFALRDVTKYRRMLTHDLLPVRFIQD